MPPAPSRVGPVALVLAIGATLAAQDPEVRPASPQEAAPPTFRTAVQAVHLDVFVTGEDGNPVPGLTVDDFELFENGASQPITTFTAVDIPPRDLRTVEAPGEPDVLTNSGPPGRVYVFALDEVRGDNALRTRHFLRQFMERHFGPDDVGAVSLLGRGLVDAGQDFTSNRRLLLAAIDRFSGGFPSFDSGGRASKSDPRQLMASLRALAEMTARVEGRHKSMLFISEGVDYNVFDVLDYRGGVLSPTGDDAHAAISAATRSNLTIYAISPAGLTPEVRPLTDRDSLRALAHATGGFSLYDSNSYPQAFDRIARESSTYYMLGFNSGHEKDDGRFVRLEVKVKRPGLRVHAREGYVAPTRDLRRAESRRRAAPTLLEDAIANPLAVRGLDMRVAAAPFRGPGRDATVSLVAELPPAGLRFIEQDGRFTATLELGYVATSAKKRIHGGPRLSAALTLRPETHRRVTAHGIRFLSNVQLPAGRYQLRVAAVAGAASGSVVYDIEVPDFSSGALTMSGVSVTARPAADALTLHGEQDGSSPAARCRPPSCAPPEMASGSLRLWTPQAAAGGEPLLQDVLPAPPTTRREFAREEVLAVYAEVYDNPRGRDAAAPEVELQASIRTPDGTARLTVAEARPMDAPRRPSGGHGFTMSLPLDSVPPGAYLLHLEARAGTEPLRTATRSIPITVR